MLKLAALMCVVSTAALAHPALIAHDHPHEASALLGLDTLFAAAIVVALALAVWKQVRS